MIRPVTLVCLLVAAGAGLHLYQVKHSVSMLDRELRDVNRQTEVARERTQILRAEWALLNEPDRLRQVAQRHLALEPMAPTQFIREAADWVVDMGPEADVLGGHVVYEGDLAGFLKTQASVTALYL
jgi:hypothetical protein